LPDIKEEQQLKGERGEGREMLEESRSNNNRYAGRKEEK